MSFDRERLLELLPAIYRRRDAEGDGTLAALLGVLAEQAEMLSEDLAQLYDDQFIETCAEWVVPYIAELVGARGMVSVKEASFSARAFVANTIRYRRRKGTIAVVEQLARDVTGWPASAVELFLKLIQTQNVNHIREANLATVDLSDNTAIERLHGPFESNAHTVDVRRMASGAGRYNIPNVAIWLWRLAAYSRTRAPAVAVDAKHFLIHPLGIDAPLVTLPQTEGAIEELAGPLNVPIAITRRALAAAKASYFGSSIVIRDGTTDVPRNDITVCDLSDDSASWTGTPPRPVAIDPQLGRIAFAGQPGAVTVTSHYAFPANLGGGEYERESSFELGETRVIRVPRDHATIGAALTALGAATGVIEITDSGRYVETFSVTLAERQRIELRADNGRCPTVILGGDVVVRGGRESELHLNGLVLAGGALHVPGSTNDLALLRVAHCTLVPGLLLARDAARLWPEAASIRADRGDDSLTIVLERTISGPLHVSPNATAIRAFDSIVDAAPPRTALVSGALTAPVTLSGAAPAIVVRLGTNAPVRVRLTAGAYGIEPLRAEVQRAVRAAKPALRDVVVLADRSATRLIVLSGTTSEIFLEPAGGDPTLATIALDAASRRAVVPFVSERLASSVTLSEIVPRLSVRIGSGAVADIIMTGGTLEQIRDALETAIRGAGAGAEYTDAIVAVDRNRLFVFGGADGAEVAFQPAANDAVTIRELGLSTGAEAVRGDLPGSDAAPLSLERCTILGTARVVSLPYVTDSIFRGAVRAKRKQTGCVRFSYVAPGSATPRRYRCQPTAPFIVPGFVSTRYTDAAYAQLTLSTPRAILAGSEQGSEMGAHSMLQQPQREANLRAALDEYLRFGLEAGIVYAT